MINFIQPYDYNLNIGKAYNEAIKPLEGWICLTDQDTLKFEGFAQRVKTIIETVDEMTILTCMTNRLRRNNKQVLSEYFNESDINVHQDVFERLWTTYGTTLTDADVIAGVCMIFHKSAWDKIKFTHNTVTFDRIFSHQAMQQGYKLRLAKGLYIFHLYRWGKDDPENNIAHLVKNHYI